MFNIYLAVALCQVILQSPWIGTHSKLTPPFVCCYSCQPGTYHKVVYRAGGSVGPSHVDVGKLAVMARHKQGGVPQQPLQAEHVSTVPEEAHRRGVPQRVRTAPHPAEAGTSAVDGHPVTDAAGGKWPAVRGEKNRITVGVFRLGADTADVPPQQAAHTLPDGDDPLIPPLAGNLQHPLINPHVIQHEGGQLRDPEPGIEQGEYHGTVPEPYGRCAVYYPEERLYLGRGERGDHLARSFGYLHPGEGVLVDYALAREPGPEGPHRAQVAVYAVGGEAVLLRCGVGVLAEPLLVLEVDDEGPDLVWTYGPGVGGPPLGDQVALQVRDAGGDCADGPGALALGASAEGVALDEDPELCGGFFG